MVEVQMMQYCASSWRCHDGVPQSLQLIGHVAKGTRSVLTDVCAGEKTETCKVEKEHS